MSQKVYSLNPIYNRKAAESQRCNANVSKYYSKQTVSASTGASQGGRLLKLVNELILFSCAELLMRRAVGHLWTAADAACLIWAYM